MFTLKWEINSTSLKMEMCIGWQYWLTYSLNILLSSLESKSTKTSHTLPNKAQTIKCSSQFISPSLWMHQVHPHTDHWVLAHIIDCRDKLGPYRASESHKDCDTINCSANWKLNLSSKRNLNLLDYKYSAFILLKCHQLLRWERLKEKEILALVNKCLLLAMGSKPIEPLIILLEGSRFPHQQEKRG